MSRLRKQVKCTVTVIAIYALNNGYSALEAQGFGNVGLIADELIGLKGEGRLPNRVPPAYVGGSRPNYLEHAPSSHPNANSYLGRTYIYPRATGDGGVTFHRSSRLPSTEPIITVTGTQNARTVQRSLNEAANSGR